MAYYINISATQRKAQYEVSLGLQILRKEMRAWNYYCHSQEESSSFGQGGSTCHHPDTRETEVGGLLSSRPVWQFNKTCLKTKKNLKPRYNAQ